MNHPWDEIWPVPEARGDFALRVLEASAQRRDKRRPWLGWLLAALVPCLVLTIGAGVAFKQHQDESAKRAAILEAQRRDTEERLRRLQTEFDMANRKEQELQASLANAKDEATRSKLQAELEGQKKATQAVRGAIRGGGGRMKWDDSRRRLLSCSPGDPLCD